MFLFNSYHFIFTFLALVIIIIYYYKKYNNMKLLRKWEIEDLLEDLKDEKPN